LQNEKAQLKKLKRVLLYFFISIGVLLVALVTSVFMFKERIINEFIREANKNLNTPVQVGKIDISMLQDFPNLAIQLNDVYVEDSQKGQYPLLTAKLISFSMNPISAYNGDYTISGLYMKDGEVNLKISAQGINNYTVVKQTPGKSGDAVKFELRDVVLENTAVHYMDIKARQDLAFTSESLLASIQSENDIYTISAKGQVTTEKIDVDGSSYFSQKAFKITSDLVYDDIKKHLTIKPSTLSLKRAAFDVHGTYSWKEKNLIDLTTKGKNADIQTLLSLLPPRAIEHLEKYQSKGDVYFHSRLKGQLGKNKRPGLSVEFGFTNATIFHPAYNTRIEGAQLRGSFASDDLGNRRFSSLVLKDISGRLNNETFEGSFVMNDFVDPEVICSFKGKLDAQSLLSFYPLEMVEDVSGSLVADIDFEGKIELLKNKTTAQRVSTTGSIELQDINFRYGKKKTSVENLSGDLQFNNNDLALSDVSGKLGSSDFLLNGFFKNVITFLLFDDQPIGIETDLRAKFLDINELFEIGFGDTTNTTSHDYAFSISRNVYLNFNCNVDHLTYKKFHGRNLTGDLLVKNEVAVSRNLSFESMGGQISLSGIVDAKNNKAIDVVSTLNLKEVNVDSAFYVFENFQQDFIEDRHLKGKATAEVNLEMTLNQNLRIFPQTLIADIGVSIRNGQLNNFEPLKKLNKYLDDEGLNKLRFADLKNDIHIENKTVYIPQMLIRSNVTDLMISGTHTFDQLIDYRVVTPLRRRKIIDVDAQGAIEENLDGQSKLFLKITGTTDEYKVSYDTEAVRKKIGSDLKREVQELKDAFKTNGKKKQKEVELEKEEYFEDW
jgi:hypothetical protein